MSCIQWTLQQIVGRAARFDGTLGLRKSYPRKFVRIAAPVRRKFLASGKRGFPAKEDRNVIPACKREQAQDIAPARLYVRHTILDGDGLHVNVRAGQQESDGHQIV